MRTIVKIFSACLLVSTSLVISGQLAHATVTTGKWYGLLALDPNLKDAKGNPVVLGEIDNSSAPAFNLNQRFKGERGIGDLQHTTQRFRDRSPTNGNPVYIRTTWAKNGSFCIRNVDVAVSAGVPRQAGVEVSTTSSCQSGWNDYGQSSSPVMHDSAWWTREVDRNFDLYSSSQRAAVQICEDQPCIYPDNCSGMRILTVDY